MQKIQYYKGYFKMIHGKAQEERASVTPLNVMQNSEL